MQDLRFEWDPAKASSNLGKHGVSFEEARTVFSDDQALVIDDPDHSDDEDRFILLGSSVLLRVLVVVHAFRPAPDTVRIISARRATTTERSTYSRRRP